MALSCHGDHFQQDSQHNFPQNSVSVESELVYTGSQVHVGEQESENNKDNIQIEREEGFVLTDTKAQCESVIIRRVWYW